MFSLAYSLCLKTSIFLLPTDCDISHNVQLNRLIALCMTAVYLG